MTSFPLDDPQYHLAFAQDYLELMGEILEQGIESPSNSILHEYAEEGPMMQQNDEDTLRA